MVIYFLLVLLSLNVKGYRTRMETTCTSAAYCFSLLCPMSLTCLSCHVKHTADISVFTSEDSDSSSSSGSDTDAKAPQQSSGSKVLIYLFLIWILFRVAEVSIKFISFCWCEGYFKTLSQWLLSLSLSLCILLSTCRKKFYLWMAWIRKRVSFAS